MKVLFRLVLVLASALWLPATSNAQQICNGKFPNLITDVCYDCCTAFEIWLKTSLC